MRSNYKQLGPYIRETNQRNSDLSVTTLLGVSIQKVFMPSIANTVGTDMSKYKVVKRNQFAYGPVTSRNGDKISVALLQDHDEAIMSQAYISFEVIDHEELDPEYLMMWFRRPEFDRYARFKSHGSARETFDWDEMCETELPIPHIEVQRAIVKEYNTITNRIALNDQLNQKLEETAQAIYRQWFVDFEFPYDFEKSEPAINGQPYKSNGGEMVWCEELEKEIPKGWEFGNLDMLSTQFSGFAFKGDKYSLQNGITVVRGENVTEKKLRWDTHKKWSLELDDRMKKCFLEANDIVIGMDGSKVGKNWSLISKFDLPLLLAQRVTSVRSNSNYEALYLYLSLLVLSFEDYVAQVQTGTSVPHISGQQIKDFPLLIPDKAILNMFNSVVSFFYDKTHINIESSKKLNDMLELLLSKMATVKTESLTTA